MTKIYIYAVLYIWLLGGCKKPAAELCNADESLSALTDFPVGVAADEALLQNDSIYRHTALAQFSRITPENILKASYIHPEQHIFNFAEADQFIQFCRNKGVTVHGHTLIWHEQNPGWMNHYTGSKQDWDSMMRLHIISVVRYFKPVIHSWDVVNEAFNEDGGLRNTIWLQHIGPSYIEKAFRYAHEADPDATLLYNDFNLESNPAKRTAVLRFLDNLKLNGVPVDGIGLQMHLSVQYSEISLIEKALTDIVSRHYLIHLSEIDISLNPLGKDYVLNEKDLEKQAELMYKIARAYSGMPARQQFGMTFWGVCDQYSWIRSYYNRMDYPLLFDEQYQPKPVYCKLKEAL